MNGAEIKSASFDFSFKPDDKYQVDGSAFLSDIPQETRNAVVGKTNEEALALLSNAFEQSMQTVNDLAYALGLCVSRSFSMGITSAEWQQALRIIRKRPSNMQKKLWRGIRQLEQRQ